MAEKLIELALAVRLELRYSKDDILSLYTSNAPFGGNVVGLEAAAWRYFGRNPDQLSRAEAAALAVLPNSPALVFPGRNEEIFLQKRNRLLGQMYSRGLMDSLTYELAKREALPGKPYPLPRTAPHLVGRVHAERPSERVSTTIDPWIQEHALHIIEDHQRMLTAAGVHNSAAIIIEVGTGNVAAYIGNITGGQPGCMAGMSTS
jgi:penicillin-binding protein 1C